MGCYGEIEFLVLCAREFVIVSVVGIVPIFELARKQSLLSESGDHIRVSVRSFPLPRDHKQLIHLKMSEVEAQEVSKKRQAEEPVEAEAPAAKKAKTAMDLFREQLEYYFSIANYPTDKWMNLTAAENDGCT